MTQSFTALMGKNERIKNISVLQKKIKNKAPPTHLTFTILHTSIVLCIYIISESTY